MSKELDAVLQAGAEQFAGATAPRPAQLIRARGDQRQHRRTAACAMLAVAVVAGAAAAAAVGGHAHRPAPVTRPRSSLDLIAPARYAPGVPNPVSFTIRSPRRARTVTVDISLSKPHVIVDRKAVVERLDQRTGNWVAVPAVLRPSGWGASYSLRVRRGDTAQHLLIVPAWPNPALDYIPPQTLGIRIMSGTGVLAQQQAPAAKVTGLLGNWSSDPNTIHPGQSGQYKLIVVNPASVSYPVRLFLHAFECANAGHQEPECHHPPAGIDFQRLDGITWESFTPGAYLPRSDGELVETVTVPAGGKLTIRARVRTTRGAPASLGEVQAIAMPDRAGFPGPARQYAPVPNEFGSDLITIGLTP
jgi:hypothetical protein